MRELLDKTREYLNYVERHYNNVQKAWTELNIALNGKGNDISLFLADDCNYFALDSKIKDHDKSKLSVEEFIQYRQYFYPTSNETKNKQQFNSAWENHLKENDHHWQTWVYKHPDKSVFSTMCLIENVCDWMSMGYEFGDTAQEYYEANKYKIQLPEWAVEDLYIIFKCLSNTFSAQ